MSVYMTEEEQIESIKKWWKKYSSHITVFISIVLLCVAGYRYWNWHQEKLTLQASNNYEQMMQAYSTQNKASVNAFANQLIKNHSSSVYADTAHLLKAKLYIEGNKSEQAINELNQVIKQTKMLPLKQVAKLRLARILSANSEYTKALSELDAVEDTAYLPYINELKGDIYAATGKYQEAVQSYQSAMSESHSKGLGNVYLEMKSNEIASMTHNTVPKDTKLSSNA